MNRREFLAATAVATFPGMTALAQRGAPAIRLGVCTYTFRKFPRDKAIAMIREAGYKYVNIKDVHLPLKLSPEEMRAAVGEFTSAGLEIVAGGTMTMNKDEAQLRAWFDYAKAAGMPVVVCAPSRENLPLLEKMVKEYNIRAAIHNHGPEDKVFPSPYDVLGAVKDLDTRVGLCMDVGHAMRTGTDVVKAAADAGPRLHDVHIKDLSDAKARDSQVAVGKGVMPVADLFRQLRKMNYKGTVDLEYEINADDPLPGVKESFNFMRGVAEKL
jgi:sugar phosphate isomerase/epimerase